MTETSSRPARTERPQTHLVVNAKEDLSPGMVRVRFRSDDLSRFADSVFTDRYVKLVFPTDDPDAPVLRTYTVLEPDADAGTLAIDFVVHGTEGVAGPWARHARPGDTLSVLGPGGAYAPDPSADWHLIAGDDAAVPACRAALEELFATAPEAVGYAVLEVGSSAYEQDIKAPAGIEVTWLYRADGDDLVETVRSLPWREGRVQAFVHGEAQEVMHGIRPYLLKERRVPREDVSISGYWRQGRTEEGFRIWKQELAEAEGA